MASTLDIARNKQREPARNRLSVTQRKWLITAHITFMAIWIGSGVCGLAFSITAIATRDPHVLNFSYVFAGILGSYVDKVGAGGSLVTGILLAVLTKWGLLRFYWINAKEILAFLCITSDLIAIRWNEQAVTLTGQTGFLPLSSTAYLTDRTLLLAGISFHVLALVGIIAISVFKPWGQRNRANRASKPEPILV